MKWIFFDINKGVTDAMSDHLMSLGGGIDSSIHVGDFKNLKCDAIVSPANSFGFMDGGIDLAYSLHFGWDMSKHLQEVIKDRWYGELPVGMAELVPTGNDSIPYLICAPTMRVPLDISDSVNVYMAMNGIMRLLSDHPDIQSVACPGLGTGVGRTLKQWQFRWQKLSLGSVFPRVLAMPFICTTLYSHATE